MTIKTNDSYYKIREELKEKDREKARAISEAFKNKIKNLSEVLGVSIASEKLTSTYETYIGVYNCKEIRIGGLLKNPIKKIIIIDTINMNVIYTGKFTEDTSHYVKILNAYTQRTKNNTGFKTKL